MVIPLHDAPSGQVRVVPHDPPIGGQSLRPIGLSAGVGLVTFGEGDGRGWFKGGHNDWTGNITVCLEVQRRCAVLLANSVRAELIYPALVGAILGGSDMPWWWEYHLE